MVIASGHTETMNRADRFLFAGVTRGLLSSVHVPTHLRGAQGRATQRLTTLSDVPPDAVQSYVAKFF